MAEFLANQNHEVEIVDNGSTYEPLLDYYRNCPFKVHRLKNIGKFAVWQSDVDYYNEEHYIVTDPDLDLSLLPTDWDKVLLEGFKKYTFTNKIGFSLDETRVPKENPAYYADEFDKYPNGNPVVWSNKLDSKFIIAPIDTTFALYNTKSVYYNVNNCLRTDRPYTVRHLPWHITVDGKSEDLNSLTIPMDDEILYYFENVENSSCSYERMIPMIKEYKEKKKFTKIKLNKT